FGLRVIVLVTMHDPCISYEALSRVAEFLGNRCSSTMGAIKSLQVCHYSLNKYSMYWAGDFDLGLDALKLHLRIVIAVTMYRLRSLNEFLKRYGFIPPALTAPTSDVMIRRALLKLSVNRANYRDVICRRNIDCF